MEFLRYIPKAYLSWFLGTLANIPLPQPLAGWLVGAFARAYRIDPASATREFRSFRSIGDFFTRDLKPELRPLGEGLVSPVDGTLRRAESIASDGTVVQVKDRSYSIATLLGDEGAAARFAQGQCWNFYLSPQDAHHIFAPASGKIVKTIHIPGRLWPVNDWALHNIEGLFAVNERVVTLIESEWGLVAVVMVGATNVGRISLAYTDCETNVRPWKRLSKRELIHEPAIAVERGAKIGTFKMGSSVVLLTERALCSIDGINEQRVVTFRSALSSLSCSFQQG
jgi:phosphatidylserine decarboxylase